MVDISDWIKRDSLASILSQADKTKQDLLKILAKEWRSFLEALLEDSTLDIRAQVKLVPSKKSGMKLEVISKEIKKTSSKPKPKPGKRKS